jgi:hypothetical protein
LKSKPETFLVLKYQKFKLTFNKNYFLVFIILFLTEVAIALFFKTGFIRHTFGDFLVVILLYSFFKSFLKGSALPMAIATLSIAYVIGFLQFTDFFKYLGLEHRKWAALVYGNYFRVQGWVAYKLGIAITLYIERSRDLNRSFI